MGLIALVPLPPPPQQRQKRSRGKARKVERIEPPVGLRRGEVG